MNEKIRYYGSALLLGLIVCAFLLAKQSKATLEDNAGLILNYESKFDQADLKESYEHYAKEDRYQINFYKNKKFELYFVLSREEKYLYAKGDWKILNSRGAKGIDYYSLVSEPIHSVEAKIRFTRFPLKGKFYPLKGEKKDFAITQKYQFPKDYVYEKFYFKRFDSKYLEDLNNKITYVNMES